MRSLTKDSDLALTSIDSRDRHFKNHWMVRVQRSSIIPHIFVDMYEHATYPCLSF
jgi:hypothetical protein